MVQPQRESEDSDWASEISTLVDSVNRGVRSRSRPQTPSHPFQHISWGPLTLDDDLEYAISSEIFLFGPFNEPDLYPSDAASFSDGADSEWSDELVAEAFQRADTPPPPYSITDERAGPRHSIWCPQVPPCTIAELSEDGPGSGTSEASSSTSSLCPLHRNPSDIIVPSMRQDNHASTRVRTEASGSHRLSLGVVVKALGRLRALFRARSRV
ncbi:hypothetical protein NP233_g11013 [Leucocoprinus birnbaumii]|uniref:Uncharacterized protein n=1 Tax=Leucocoprinus birnbaumii TaxID=56174 RepID=A0AAD5VJN8_9AGAR|nr:hypothetical protein NP233_g11013 [Leucocoprinus birnbaumii]